MIDVTKIRLELDYLWSIKLGACIRVYSFHKPYTHTWHSWSKCGQYLNTDGAINKTSCPANCPCYLNREIRYPHTTIYPCAPGQCVIGIPDINGGSKFWTRSIEVLQKQVNDRHLLFNNIPTNWYKLKMEANPQPLHQASDGKLMEHLREYLIEK